MSSPIMLRDLLSQSQSDSDEDEKQQKRNPAGNNARPRPAQPRKDDEEFVPVNHDDVADDDDHESEMHRVLRPFLGLQRQGQRNRVVTANKYDDLHPYTQILSLSNLEACIAVENAAFPEHERCSRDKVCLALSLKSKAT